MSNSEVIALSIVVWNVLGFFFMIVIALREGYYGAYIELNVLNPVYIYKHTECNPFVVICLTIVVNLLCPAITIGYWVYKLCTVGRK